MRVRIEPALVILKDISGKREKIGFSSAREIGSCSQDHSRRPDIGSYLDARPECVCSKRVCNRSISIHCHTADFLHLSHEEINSVEVFSSWNLASCCLCSLTNSLYGDYVWL
jgi:hypothetical protein